MIVFALLAGCTEASLNMPVRSTLDDGQVLFGTVSTESLRLISPLGELEVPLDDVGEVVPVEGGLAESGNQVSVWLRNGTELRGRWAEPELEMDIAVGGKSVPVRLPMDRLERVQTQGGEAWPDQPVYRVRTVYGDDFLVDAESTRIELENDLGHFAPFLSECASVRPVGASDGDWRVELATGTVLIGALRAEGVRFALPLGPLEIEVPLAALVSVSQQDWSGAPELQLRKQPVAARSWGAGFKQDADATPEAAAPAQAGEWFNSSSLQQVKQRR